MRKRGVCFLLLCLWFSVSAFAAEPGVPDIEDGVIEVFAEYHNNIEILQSACNESNCNLNAATMYWIASPKDNSVYLGVEYECADYVPGGGLTGVEVKVNSVYCGTAHTNNTFSDVDPKLFEAECHFHAVEENTIREHYMSFEMRIGIKEGMDKPIEMDLSILDCSGIPSNHYRKVVYDPYTTKPAETSAQKTTKERTTKEERSQTAKETTEKKTEEETTTTHVSKPVITAAPSDLTLSSSSVQSASAVTFAEAPKAVSAAKLKSSAAKKTTKRAISKTKAKSTKTTTTKTASVESVTEPFTEIRTAEPITTAQALQETQSVPTTLEQYRAISRFRTIGYVFVAVLLTSAFFLAVFTYAKPKSNEPEPPTPEEEHEDFG